MADKTAGAPPSVAEALARGLQAHYGTDDWDQLPDADRWPWIDTAIDVLQASGSGVKTAMKASRGAAKWHAKYADLRAGIEALRDEMPVLTTELCGHEPDEHSEGCCDVCDLAFAIDSEVRDRLDALLERAR